MKSDIIELGIFKNIFHLANRIQVEGDKLSEELTLKQWFLLALLYKSPVKEPSVNDIASAMGVTRQSAKKMVDTLEKTGYLSVSKSPSDNRALCIRPTQKAYRFFQRNQSLGCQLLEQMFAGIDEDELAAAQRVLSQMKDNLKGGNRNGAHMGRD